MRNYMFRGKKVYGDGWAYGSLVKRGEYCCILEDTDSDEIFMDAETGVIDGNLTQVMPETVGQYTGLSDKFDKHIFEGDIVKTKYGRVCRAVWFESEQYCGWDFKPMNGKKDRPDKWDLFFWRNLEVIGNIHDNPELTEV